LKEVFVAEPEVPMLHIVTVHYSDPSWIDIQLRQIRKYAPTPHRIYASLEGIPADYSGRFDVVIPSMGRHEGKLNLLASEVSRSGSATDLIMFLDGDAFPVGDIHELCGAADTTHDVVAVQREENLGDIQPHPLFAIMTLRAWRSLHGDWSPGSMWFNSAGNAVTDVGGNMLHAIKSADASWRRIFRSNRRNLHPVWFGVYGDVIYHHGAGFRAPLSRVDLERQNVPVSWRHGNLWQKVVYRSVVRSRTRNTTKQSGHVFDLLKSSPEELADFFLGYDYMLSSPGFWYLLDNTTTDY
jgi:hypothetical protein